MNGNAKILYVEDEPELRDIVCTQLAPLQRPIVTAANGKLAIHILREQTPEAFALILCDLNMPESNGLDFLREATAAFGYVPIVFVTAYGSVNSTTEALRLGAIDFIAKPYAADDLLARIPTWIEIGRRQRSLDHAGQADAKMRNLLRLKTSRG